jgi:hypothetical protein
LAMWVEGERGSSCEALHCRFIGFPCSKAISATVGLTGIEPMRLQNLNIFLFAKLIGGNRGLGSSVAVN